MREGRWRALIGAAGLIVGLGMITLPLVGTESWAAWVTGLRHYQESQGVVEELYGLALPRFVPVSLFAAITVAAVMLAPPGPGRRRPWPAWRRRNGRVTIPVHPRISPLVFPALLGLRGAPLWFALAITSGLAQGGAWWIPIGIIVAGWLGVGVSRRPVRDGTGPSADGVLEFPPSLHPMGSASELGR